MTRKALLELVPLLPRFLFRCGLLKVIVPMLAAGVGVVAGVKAFLFRCALAAGGR
ncbi:MAG TPA: hypothetical protein VFD64_00115 [Gemmatimonadaceae bacterium]|nr:hypothetical protein [Gemmatimonadaceae bacterium]